MFIVTLTVEQEWKDRNAASRQGNMMDFGLAGSPSSPDFSPMAGWDGGGGGGGGRRGTKRHKNKSTVMGEEGKKEDEDGDEN